MFSETFETISPGNRILQCNGIRHFLIIYFLTYYFLSSFF